MNIVKQNLFIEINKTNIDEYLQDYQLIICKIRNSRLKAKQIALLEMVFAQYENKITAVKNSPLGDIKGIFSVLCPKDKLEAFKDKLFGIGYCCKYYLLDFADYLMENRTDLRSINPLIWKGKKFSVVDFYSEDNDIYIKHSAHNREFKIADNNGEVKTICGYRGDGSEMGRRSLPVEDARCMVNLSIPHINKKMLDPFAGAGGIIFEFNFINPHGSMTSIDIDPVLKPGLEFYGSSHFVMNAADASFPENSFDSIVTETPFSEKAADDIIAVLRKLNLCVSNNGVFVIMCKKNQFLEIHKTMTEFNYYFLFNHKIDRKGTDVEISIWWKNKDLFSDINIESFISDLKTLY